MNSFAVLLPYHKISFSSGDMQGFHAVQVFNSQCFSTTFQEQSKFSREKAVFWNF